MKIFPFIAVIISICSLCFYSCNSKGYDIEEEVYIDTTAATSSKAEIKQEIKEPNSEIKQETTNKSGNKKSYLYSIQLGAFENESNAIDFMDKAEKIINYKINFYLIDGLYKVRLDEFKTKEEAVSILHQIINSGYSDAFIVEIPK